MGKYDRTEHNKQEAGSRIQWLDICKGILIFNVILRYLLTAVNEIPQLLRFFCEKLYVLFVFDI